jgi:hypothetical protein
VAASSFALAPGLIDGPALRVAAAYPARWRPTSPIRLAHRPRDKTSRLPQPSLSDTRLQVALDAAQQTGPDVFTGMNRNGRHTLAAFDAQMRAWLPALDASAPSSAMENRNNAQCAPSARFGFSMPFASVPQRPWVLIVKSGDFRTNFDEGDGLKTVIGAREKVRSAKC